MYCSRHRHLLRQLTLCALPLVGVFSHQAAQAADVVKCSAPEQPARVTRLTKTSTGVVMQFLPLSSKKTGKSNIGLTAAINGRLIRVGDTLCMDLTDSGRDDD
jgi:hypothetical protein